MLIFPVLLVADVATVSCDSNDEKSIWTLDGATSEDVVVALVELVTSDTLVTIQQSKL